MRGLAVLIALLTAGNLLSACASEDPDSIVAATPTAITITSIRFTEPTDAAQKHCAKYGRKAVSRGGVKLGAPTFRVMWGFDCVDQ